MADGWRSNYLARRGLGDDATEYEMESEFWKLVGPDPPEDNVKVLYGSDLDTASVGSGFPWTRTNVNGVGGVGAANATAAAASRLAASEQVRLSGSERHGLWQRVHPLSRLCGLGDSKRNMSTPLLMPC